MSAYLWYKIIGGVAIVIAACIYGFWRGWNRAGREINNERKND